MNLPNNPLMSMLGLMRSGGNPIGMLQQMAGADPQYRQIMQMVQGKSEPQLREMVMGIARNQGVNVEQMARSMGIPVYRKTK